MKKIFWITLVSVCFIFIAQSGFCQSTSELKIGFVDLSKAFDEFQKTKDFDKQLEKKGSIKEEERDKLVKELKKIRDEVELMNESARKKKEEEIGARVKSLQEFDQSAKTELTKERDDMVRDILKEIDGVIRDYGERNGYLIILNERVLLYGNNTLDLTTEIIRILNGRYNSTKK